ncbi:hypothetical protein OIU84_019379 [Salix udensis]|uniref:J domain-containing protein n=1 Tax=Salix udensis TaxID=889485 RepID=A0AAD6L0K5_9ROSI|nr:hypothetical protein OIU84_019379 [Salix udensis]
MARKGNQHRNGVDRHSSNHKNKVSDSDSNGRGKGSGMKVYPGEEPPNGNQPSNPTDRGRKTAHAEGEDNIKKNSGCFHRKENQEVHKVLDVEEPTSSMTNSMDCGSPSVETPGVTQDNGKLPGSESGPEHIKSGLGHLLSDLNLKNMMDNMVMVVGDLRASALSMLKVAVIWCSILSVIAMVGISKILIFLAIAAFVGVFIGLILGLLIVAISGLVFLWLYGSFWTTVFVIIISGLAFMFSQERLTLLIITVYSTYCVWSYVGWLGLLLALNLSFISSDILVYFLKNNINRQRRSGRTSEHSAGMEGRPGFFNGDSFETGPGLSADRSPGVPSTSGADSELTSEEEVVRLLNCTDHYSALGLSRNENVDVSVLKREYRKKAMLVHPDKNMGNEKAAEAFKKLQNAYEVLLDSLKRKAYDDELRREDLLNYFRSFQSTSQKNGEHGLFASGNLKSQARWCQDCQDFHLAKDGDGWVEQSSQPFLFGLLQKVDVPTAYVCADSKVYDATDWYICQGMRCPANSHKPSFHVNTSVTAKHNTSKGSSSGQKSGRMPTPNMEETMTEEEFFEWLQNAVHAGAFNNQSAGTSTESPSAKGGNGPKSSGGGSSSSGNRRKKKGKKQW